MKLHCFKYQGAGNDFVILDNRKGDVNLTDEQVHKLCDRRYGIGSDGLMLLGARDGKYDFTMRYFNADGPEGTMCGNGGRCLVAFAAHCGIKQFEFTAIDGYHRAEVLEYSPSRCIVRLKMRDLMLGEGGEKPIEAFQDGYFLDTGSPHFVQFVDDINTFDVDGEGKRLRWDKRWAKGTNVNFVQPVPEGIKVRTYERGVEAETWACGTGCTASSITSYYHGVKSFTTSDEGENKRIKFAIQALGDKLAVDFIAHPDGSFEDIYLTGPATKVFETDIEI